ncbi:MAG: hypothetical protein Q8S33_05670 [Myxococcales bacterium]|nr:hypothetical protein [Myxococcales bacterium]MDP3499797.1 hypothetical protein [Myxococcales bacterium]
MLVLLVTATTACVTFSARDRPGAALPAVDPSAPDGGHGSTAVETSVEAIVEWLQNR